MKILLALNSLSIGGTESYALTVAEHLDRLAHEVAIYTPEPGREVEIAHERGLRVLGPNRATRGGRRRPRPGFRGRLRTGRPAPRGPPGLRRPQRELQPADAAAAAGDRRGRRGAQRPRRPAPAQLRRRTRRRPPAPADRHRALPRPRLPAGAAAAGADPQQQPGRRPPGDAGVGVRRGRSGADPDRRPRCAVDRSPRPAGRRRRRDRLRTVDPRGDGDRPGPPSSTTGRVAKAGSPRTPIRRSRPMASPGAAKRCSTPRTWPKRCAATTTRWVRSTAIWSLPTTAPTSTCSSCSSSSPGSARRSRDRRRRSPRWRASCASSGVLASEVHALLAEKCSPARPARRADRGLLRPGRRIRRASRRLASLPAR